MTLPANAVLRELPYQVLPENAANKEIDIIYNGKKVSLGEDGAFPASSFAMNRTYTLKATDGSNITAKFKYVVPKIAWFSIENNTTIDSPDGIDFFYVSTYEYSDFAYTVYDYDDGKAFECKGKFINKAVLDELLKDEPYYINYDTCSTFIGYMHVVPLKVGKGSFIVETNGHKTSLNLNITRSAVYENIKYEQYQKSEEKNKSLRFQASGIVYTTDGSNVYLSYDGDETKQILVMLPEEMNNTSLTPGKEITVKGIFTGMSDYKTETGLKKSIPVITAEIIEQKNLCITIDPGGDCRLIEFKAILGITGHLADKVIDNRVTGLHSLQQLFEFLSAFDLRAGVSFLHDKGFRIGCFDASDLAVNRLTLPTDSGITIDMTNWCVAINSLELLHFKRLVDSNPFCRGKNLPIFIQDIKFEGNL